MLRIDINIESNDNSSATGLQGLHVMWIVVVLFTGLSAIAAEREMPKGLHEAYKQALEEHGYDAVRQEVVESEALGVLHGAYRANNRARNLRFYFTQDGVHIEPRVSTDDSAGVKMVLSRYGFEDHLQTVPRVEPDADGRRVEYHYADANDGPALVEWYENSSMGLEHGFTIPAPPAGDGDGNLIFAFDLEGDAIPQLSGNGSSILFKERTGRTVFNYGKLYVHDANRQTLPARLELRKGCPAITVDARAAVYPLTVDPLFSTEVKLTAQMSDAAADDNFGGSNYSDTAVSISGNTAIVGVENDDDSGSASGSAYVFVRSGESWIFQKKLIAADAAPYDLFGCSVSIYGDTAIVGAVGDDDNGNSSGSVYVFVRSGTIWTQQQKLAALDAEADNLFGNSVSAYGDTAVIGANRDNDSGSNSGSAYVFVRSGTTWTQQQKLTAADAAAGDYFGWSISISGDTAVVGAYQDDDGGSNSGSAYVFVRSGTTWTQQQKLTAVDAAVDDCFGISVSISGETVVVGAHLNDDNGSDSGSAYVFVRSGTIWTQQQKLVAADAAADDNFGRSVCVSGDTAIVGALYDDDSGNNSGSAYMFIRSGTTWVQQQKLTAADAAADDLYGYSVFVSGDIAIIGALYDDDGGSDSGSAYTYQREGTTWTQSAKLTAVKSDAAADDEFGYSVSIAGDTAVVGAKYNDDGGSSSGSAYVFVRNGMAWTLQQKLTAADAGAGDEFGCSVSVSGDTIIVGAYRDDDGGGDSGAAYVFVRSGSAWTQQQKLTAADAAASDEFGCSVSISGDTAIVGAKRDDDGGSDSGSAYVFVRSGTTWTQQQKLTAADAAASDEFGVSISVSSDTAIVGSHFDDDGGSDSGSAYVFVRSGTTWSQQQKLTAADATASDRFGSSISVSGDTVIVGARFDDDGGSDSGSAYVFLRSGTTWTQQQKLTAADAGAGDEFGFSVSISGDIAVVGAYRDDDGGSDSGSAYVFVRSGTTWTQQKKLTAADAAASDYFGNSVSVSGNITIVGGIDDDDGGSNSGSAYIYKLYDPITAEAGANANAVSGQILALNATPGGGDGSYTYTWAINSGPNTNANQLTSTTTEDPNFTPAAAGTYVLQFTVNDGIQSPVNDTVTITSYDPVTSEAGANANAVAGQVLALNATPGGGDGSYTYTWAINSGPNTDTNQLSSTTAEDPNFTPTAAVLTYCNLR